MNPPTIVKTDDPSTLAYILGVRRCWGILEAKGYKPSTIDMPSINFTFASNGCSHCRLSGYDQDGVYITVDVKMDAKPDHTIIGEQPQLNSFDQPNIYLIREDLRVDGVWTNLYSNPSYSDRTP